MKVQALVTVMMVSAMGCASAKKQTAVPVEEMTALVQNAGPAENKAPEKAEGDRTEANLRTVYFNYNSADVDATYTEQLNRVATNLKADPDAKIVIEGHCDDRGSTEFNLALGERRAVATKNHLKRLGIPEKQMRVISYGEERPAVTGEGESAWAQNRRAELTVE